MEMESATSPTVVHAILDMPERTAMSVSSHTV